jgi:acyl carrier protein
MYWCRTFWPALPRKNLTQEDEIMKRFELRKIVADVLEIGPDDIDSDTDLTTMETFDSVSILTLMIELDERAGIKMTPADTRGLRFYADIEKLAEKQGIVLTD